MVLRCKTPLLEISNFATYHFSACRCIQGTRKREKMTDLYTHTQTDTHYHQKAFIIPPLPAVIDWSICLCTVHKWGTWYSALFICNQLRQRCCVNMGSVRGSVSLFLSLSLSHSIYERDSSQEEGWERGGAVGGGCCVCSILC